MVRRHCDVLILIAAATACGRLEPDAAVLPPDDAVAPRWRLETPAIDLAPAEQGYYCSYHPIPADLGPIGRIGFYGLGGVHDLALEIMPGPVGGGLVDQICARPPSAVTLFSLERQVGELALPEDAPLLLGDGLVVVARIHFLNPDDAPTRSQATISWFAATGASQTTSGLVSAIRTDVSVPPGASSTETSCVLPSDVRVAAAYPVAHRLAYRLAISDDNGVLASTFDWAHPPRASWTAPYYQPSGVLRTRCEYMNTTGQTVGGGDRLLLDERCGVSALVVPGSGLTTCSM